MSSLPDPLPQALALHQAGHLDQARALYLELLGREPDHADATHLLGFLRYQQGEGDAALALIRHAIALAPQQALYHANLGVVLKALGQTDAAEASLLRAHLLDPGVADVCNNLGACSSARGLHEAAAVWFQRAAALQPDLAPAWHNLGLALAAQGRADLGLPHFERAAGLRPGWPEAHHDLGCALADTGQHEAAASSLRRALALRPDDAGTLSNLVTQLTRLGQADEALTLARRAVSLQPALTSAWTGLGQVLQHAGATAEAGAALRRAHELDPASPSVGLNLALNLLSQGDFAAGWPAYEARLRLPGLLPLAPPPDAPRWLGQPLAGRRLLLQAEQGLGDTLQFARFAPMLARQGAQVMLQCQPPLLRLMASLAGVQAVLSTDQAAPPCDLHCPLMSLPLGLGIGLQGIPADVPYLRADPSARRAWQGRLDALAAGRLRVGLCWRGSPGHAADAYRSMPLSAFTALADLEGVCFVSLQRDRPAEPAESLDRPVAAPLYAPLAAQLHDPTSELQDMADMAALIDGLDLVISVDTAVCHLAGALGKPVWVLLHAGPDFRWLMGREDSPWYPTARLFRQARLGDWGPVIEQVKAALAARVSGKRGFTPVRDPAGAWPASAGLEALSTSQRGGSAATGA